MDKSLLKFYNLRFQDRAKEAKKALFELLPSSDIEVQFWQAYYLFKKDDGPDPEYISIIKSIYPLILSSNKLEQPMRDFMRGFVAVEMNLDLENINGMEMLIQSASAGNLHAQRRIGIIYRDGKFIGKNIDKAIQWFESACLKGDATSCSQLTYIFNRENPNQQKEMEFAKRGCQLGSPYLTAYYGQYYYNGLFIKQDFEKALYYFEMAAEMGDAQSNLNVGLFYSGFNEHYRSKFDYDKAIFYLTKAIKLGKKEGEYYLARLYFAHPTRNDLSEALELLIPLAESGDLESQYFLGIAYKDHTYKIVDCEKSIYWLTKAAENNHVESQMELHGIYRSGNITPKDLKKAELWLTKAYENKYNLAIIYMIDALRKGTFGNKNPKKAIEILLDNIEANDSNFQNLLGAAYLEGDGVAINENLAFRYFSIAVEKGDTNAMVNLGEMYLKNQSYSPEVLDPKSYGMNLLEESAKRGNIEAAMRLGEIFEFGKFDIEKSIPNSIQWYEKAAEHSHESATLSLVDLYFNEPSSQNIEKGMYWLKKMAIEKGNPIAQFHLGYQYIFGKNIEKDEKKGIFWLTIASETNDDACVFLGEYYLYMPHLKEKIDQGISFLKKAIYRNKAIAMTSLGEYLIEKNPNEVNKGIKYLEKACLLKEKNACYILGMSYYKGLLLEPNKQKAYEYLKKASDFGITNNAILGLLETDLEKREADHSFDIYAQKLLLVEESFLKITIHNNLEEDFGPMWNVLHPETKKFFISGLLTYRTLKKLDNGDINLDFSSVILSFTKGLENELYHYLFELYHDYLKENYVKAEDFSGLEKENFFNKNDKLINLSKEGPNFTLGRIKYIMFTKTEFKQLIDHDLQKITRTLIGNENLKNDFTFESGLLANQQRQDRSTVQVTRFNAHFISFIKHLFKEDAFDVEDYDEELLGFLINFKRQLLEINDLYRNTAAHRESHNAHAAEICANWIFKKNKLLASFLEKIKPHYFIQYN